MTTTHCPTTTSTDRRRQVRQRARRPAADIYETEAAVVLRLAVPGVSADDVEIVIEKDVLAITAPAPVSEPEDIRYAHREIGGITWQRSFRLGDGLDHEGIDAELTDGVLHVEVPKAPQAQARRISVR